MRSHVHSAYVRFDLIRFDYIHVAYNIDTQTIDGHRVCGVCGVPDRCNFVSHLIETHLFNAIAADDDDDGCCCRCFYLFPWLRSSVCVCGCAHTPTAHDSFATALVVNMHDSLVCYYAYDNCAFQIKFDPDFTVTRNNNEKKKSKKHTQSSVCVYKWRKMKRKSQCERKKKSTTRTIDPPINISLHNVEYGVEICKCKLIIVMIFFVVWRIRYGRQKLNWNCGKSNLYYPLTRFPCFPPELSQLKLYTWIYQNPEI